MATQESKDENLIVFIIEAYGEAVLGDDMFIKAMANNLV